MFKSDNACKLQETRQRSYANIRRKPLEFQVGDHVMLKVSPRKGVIRFGKRGKLNPRYIRPFKILERIGPVTEHLMARSGIGHAGTPSRLSFNLRIIDEVVQDQRQRDDNDLQDERQDQPKKEEVEPRRSKRARTEKLFGPDFVSFMVENEPTSYREAVTSSE
ncbi:hypothetical protein Tco_0307780 [Tanacetum coccineum]